MTATVGTAVDVSLRVLEGFELSLYHWNMLTDQLQWIGVDSGLIQQTGLSHLSRGDQFADMREDGGDRTAWALNAQAGDTARFFFAVPTGPATVTWIEDQVRRVDIDGIPHVAGVLRRVASPRQARAAFDTPGGGREARARLIDFLATHGPLRDRSYVLFGVDNLRDLNRTLGADVTDEIIAEVECRITATRPAGARYGRVGSAKFALGDTGSGPEAITQIARRIMEAVGREAIGTSCGPVAVTLSAGICHVPAGTPLPGDPLSAAQSAYDEGRIGRIESLRFARTTGGPTSFRERCANGARLVMDALGEHRVTVAYQPIVRAEDPGTVAFHECLARILDRDGQEVPAGSFMPAIEHLGLVRQVDRAVLASALGTLAAYPDIRLSVNLSPQSMHDTEWMSIFEDGLRATPEVGDRLIIEITESSAILDPGRTLAFMNRVRQQGCAFALDDFGAGYTSFRHFRDFRFDAVKIDGSFVTGIAQNGDNQILVRTLVSIADHFSMFTVAEFVEAEEDAAFLGAMGIDCLQGYRYGRPQIRPAWLSARSDLRHRA